MRSRSSPSTPFARRLAGCAAALAIGAVPFAQAQTAQPGTAPEGTPSPGPEQPAANPAAPGTGSTTTPAGSGSGMGSGSASGSSGAGMTSGTTSGSMGLANPWGSGDSFSLLPWTRRGYVGLNVGQPRYPDGNCGLGFGCDNPNTRMRLYTGGLVNDWLGAELGYIHEGSQDRGGGTTRAQGINLSLVLRAPLGQVNLFGKVGATYGETKVSADALSLLATGTERGWGRSMAVGVGYDFTPSFGVVLEWERNRYHFAGDVRDDVDSTSLGLVYRF